MFLEPCRRPVKRLPTGEALLHEPMLNELKQPADFFDKIPAIKPAKELTDLAVQLINKKRRLRCEAPKM